MPQLYAKTYENIDGTVATLDAEPLPFSLTKQLTTAASENH